MGMYTGTLYVAYMNALPKANWWLNLVTNPAMAQAVRARDALKKQTKILELKKEFRIFGFRLSGIWIP